MMIRQLGAIGPVVSAIGLGCMEMSEFYGCRALSKSGAGWTIVGRTRQQWTAGQQFSRATFNTRLQGRGVDIPPSFPYTHGKKDDWYG